MEPVGGAARLLAKISVLFFGENLSLHRVVRVGQGKGTLTLASLLLGLPRAKSSAKPMASH